MKITRGAAWWAGSEFQIQLCAEVSLLVCKESVEFYDDRGRDEEDFLDPQAFLPVDFFLSKDVPHGRG